MDINAASYTILVDPALEPHRAKLGEALPPAVTEMLLTSEAPQPEEGRIYLAQLIPSGSARARRSALSEAGLHDLPLIEVDAEHPELLVQSVSELLLARMKRSEAAGAAARETAAMLRRENITTTARFRELESFLHVLGNPHVSQILSWETAGEFVELEADEVILQHLPLDAVSVSAVDLWLPERVFSGRTQLDVSILDSTGARHLLEETMDPLRLGSGWVRFVLPGAIVGSARNCALELRNAGPGRLVVGLGMRVPDPHFAAKINQVPEERVLAVRVWRALASALIPEQRSGALIDAMSPSSARLIRPSSLPTPQIFAAPSSASDYVTVDYWSAEDAVMVHPSRSGPVCAIIRDVPMAGLLQLSAVVTAGNARSPNLNFAIGVTPHGALPRDGFWESCIGAWVHGLPAHGWAQAHCVPASPIDRADIYLAASLALDAPNDNSWAMFTCFRAVTADRVEMEIG